MITKKYYQDEPENIRIQSLINIIQEKNWVITITKIVRKNYHFSGNEEQVISIYASIWNVYGMVLSYYHFSNKHYSLSILYTFYLFITVFYGIFH